MKDQILDKSDFDDWYKNQITKELMSLFASDKEDIIEQILTIDPINDVNSANKLAYLRGCLQICERLLSIEFKSIINEEVKSEDEETPYSW